MQLTIPYFPNRFPNLFAVVNSFQRKTLDRQRGSSIDRALDFQGRKETEKMKTKRPEQLVFTLTTILNLRNKIYNELK
jgi:hypothetical protein